MDTGVDDAMAILLAVKSPELKVEAITTVSGNVHVDKTSENSLKVLEIAGMGDIPVAKGMERPLVRRLETGEAYHGKDGLGDTDLPPPRLGLHPKHAVELLIEKVMSYPGEITLIPTGPLTNVAKAFLREPRMIERIKGIILMGGAFAVTSYGHGNVGPVSEFNVWCDPEAARIVFRSGLPITAVGLDVTADPSACLSEKYLRRFRSIDTPIAKLIVKLSEFRLGLARSIRLHDPLAVAVAIDGSLVKTKKYWVDVETKGEITRGETVADRRPRWRWRDKVPNVDVCYGVDGERFLDLFTNRLTIAS